MCGSDLSTEKAIATSWHDRFYDQQKTINALQAPQLQQQATINSCVVSLGKMNPTVRREVRVIRIPFGILDAKTNRFVSQFAPNKLYESVIVITTNEEQSRPSGYLRCIEAFNIVDSPQLPPVAQTAMIGMTMPIPISDHEYQINVSNTGSYWGPSTPIYMTISSETENLTGCVFTPQ